jgi:hypothetical protein
MVVEGEKSWADGGFLELWLAKIPSDSMKSWEETPTELPAPDVTFSCPDCSESRRLAEFMRTDRDLETLKEFH